MKKSVLNIDELIDEYKKCGNLHSVSKKFNTSHIRVSKLLRDYGVEINCVGKKKNFTEEEISCMISDYVDLHLTMEEISHKYSIRIKRLRSLFRERGVIISKWNGHIKKEKKKSVVINRKTEKPFKQCPYCFWKTYDIDNKSHAFQKHILHKHNISYVQHLEKYPEDEKYFLNMIKKEKMVTCKICGKKLHLIDNRHLSKHGINKFEYINTYGNEPLISIDTKEKLRCCINKMNENNQWERKSSSYEKEIKDVLLSYNIDVVQNDRTVLGGLEIDFLIGNIGIEFHGNQFHTEYFGGKTRQYHLNKTVKRNESGFKLLQIFEDEYVNPKDIVINKILHIIGCTRGLSKIFCRHCSVNEILLSVAEDFLNKYHIQGFSSSTVYLGGFYDNKLIAVTSFKQEIKGSNKWELTRFASDYNYICCGVGGKLFNWFIKNYKPTEVKSFADRRWTLDKDNNLYTKLGFVLEKELKPDYKYYNAKVDKYKRFHKFNFRKQTLHRKYGFPLTMTETEMVKELGFDRIWDCGLFKFVWVDEDVKNISG